MLAPFGFISPRNASLPAGQFAFGLASDQKVSIGIYNGDTLIRTYESNVDYVSGSFTKSWDGKNDAGVSQSGTFPVKIQQNTVTYDWNIIGNSSYVNTGSTVITYLRGMQTMTFVGNTGYYGVGFTEGRTSIYRFNRLACQAKVDILPSENGDANLSIYYVAKNKTGTMIVQSGNDPFDTTKSFTYATWVATNLEVHFTSGTPASCIFGRTYNWALDIVDNNAAIQVTGVACSDNYIFVARGGANSIKVYNISNASTPTGAFVREITGYTNPRQLFVDANDDLWMMYSTGTVEKFDINGDGTITTKSITLTGLVEPLALAVTDDAATIGVIDGGSSQQVKGFSNSTGGSASWTLGSSGGYTTDPTVTNTKFYFSDNIVLDINPFIAFDSAGSMWLGDSGNQRVMNFDSSRNYVQQIISMGTTYSVYADRNNPTRVWNDYLEFAIDYSLPIAPDNGSWRLVRNYRAFVPAPYAVEGITNLFRNVITLSNGRTYATIENRSTPDVRYPEVVELLTTGTAVRFTGILFEAFSLPIIETNGSLRKFVSSGLNVGDSNPYWTNQTLTSFNGSNNPVWGSPTTLATVPITAGCAFEKGMSNAVMTTDNVLIAFCPTQLNTGMHFGGVKIGSSTFTWQCSMSTAANYAGNFPTNGMFDIGNSVWYAGGISNVLGTNVYWNYIGEGWKNSQVNKWNHYTSIGLMVTQFGITTPEAIAIDGPYAPLKAAGNAFSSNAVQVSGVPYIFHNDESVHGGIHVWKGNNYNSIIVQNTTVVAP